MWSTSFCQWMVNEWCCRICVTVTSEHWNNDLKVGMGYLTYGRQWAFWWAPDAPRVRCIGASKNHPYAEVLSKARTIVAVFFFLMHIFTFQNPCREYLAAWNDTGYYDPHFTDPSLWFGPSHDFLFCSPLEDIYLAPCRIPIWLCKPKHFGDWARISLTCRKMNIWCRARSSFCSIFHLVDNGISWNQLLIMPPIRRVLHS